MILMKTGFVRLNGQIDTTASGPAVIMTGDVDYFSDIPAANGSRASVRLTHGCGFCVCVCMWVECGFVSDRQDRRVALLGLSSILCVLCCMLCA